MKIISDLKGKHYFTVLISTMFLFVFYVEASSQQVVLGVKTEVENASGRKAMDGGILVKCITPSSDYLYLLYDEKPLANAEIIQKSERTAEAQYKFEGLKAGTYFVCVYDRDNNSACYKVEIGHN
jgi:hypothetical protein